jgi:high-affinity iron transporter
MVGGSRCGVKVYGSGVGVVGWRRAESDGRSLRSGIGSRMPIHYLGIPMRHPISARAAALAAFLAVLLAAPARAQDELPARRLASIVGVAVEEYAKGIDSQGHLVSAQEYEETVGFLADAKSVAQRLPGDRAPAIRSLLDSLAAAVRLKRPPNDLVAIHARFTAALGAEGQLELPEQALSVADGRAVYERNCASCHGALGRGDGPAARGMNPAPPAIADPKDMRGASPALMYRVMSVGVPGTPMPPWGSTLSAQQRWNVVAYLQSLRASQSDVAEVEGLFLGRCASCHGATGGSDGELSRTLSHVPPVIGSLAWQVARSDSQLAAVVRRGLPGTAMPASPDLRDEDVNKVVAYLRTLPIKRGESESAIARSSASDTTTAAVSRRVMSTLDQSLAAAQNDRTADAGDRAFDAYIAFEPLETTARARNPARVASMEKHFADFKAAVKSGDLRGAQRSRDAIEAGLPAIIELLRPVESGWSAFLQSLLIILREGFEAILVIGAVVAFLLKTGNRRRLRSIWGGVVLGLLASVVTAVVLRTVLSAVPASQDIIEGITMLIAVAVLFSVSYWLISKVEAAKWQQFIREKVSAALEQGGGKTLAFVAFLAVYREGAEVALFFQALFGEGQHVVLPLSLGIVVGFALLAVIFTLFYRFGVRVPLRPFFAVTSVLLYYMAFVFIGKGVRELQEGNALSITLLSGFPHVEAMGIYPTVEGVLAQLFLLTLFVFALVKTFWPRRSVALPTAPPQGTPVGDVNARRARLEDRVRLIEEGTDGGSGAARIQEGGERERGSGWRGA